MPDIFRACLVVNPHAKQYVEHETRKALEACLHSLKSDCEIHFIEASDLETTRQLLRSYLNEAKHDVIIPVGGDGTIRETVKVLLDYPRTPLCILPFGTGNLLAKSLGLPLEPVKALELIATGSLSRLNVIKANNSVSLVAVGIGLDSLIMTTTPSLHKKLLGMLAYFIQGLLHWFKLDKKRFRLTVDDKKPIIKACHSLLAITRRQALQQAFFIPPDNKLGKTEGTAYLCLLHLKELKAIVKAVQSILLSDDITSNEGIETHSFKTLRIKTRKPMPYQVDGDVLGNTPLKLTFLPEAIQVFVPSGD